MYYLNYSFRSPAPSLRGRAGGEADWPFLLFVLSISYNLWTANDILV